MEGRSVEYGGEECGGEGVWRSVCGFLNPAGRMSLPPLFPPPHPSLYQVECGKKLTRYNTFSSA